MKSKNKFEHNGFKYETHENELKKSVELKLDHSKSVPDYLYKYYGLNKNSVDAVINNYLFSSHPVMNNDKYDCAGELINYSNLELPVIKHHLVTELDIYSEEEVESLYKSGKKWILERKISVVNQLRLYMKFGIISLTENYKDILMWAYYTQNKGFAVKFERKKLPENIFGPYPINYVPKLEKINFLEYEISLCIYYQTNVKHNIWKHENEWRYVTYNPDGKFHPIYWSFDIKSRKFYYNTAAIKEIILGYDFFNLREMDYSKGTSEYDIINFSNKKSRNEKKLKLKLLNFILQSKIPCYQIIRNLKDYQLEKVEIKIERLGSNKFKIYNFFKDHL